MAEVEECCPAVSQVTLGSEPTDCGIDTDCTHVHASETFDDSSECVRNGLLVG